MSFPSHLWRPADFYVGNGLRCAWELEAVQTLPWEIFRGQLVQPTRERRTFRTWNLLPVVNGAVAAEPLVSLLVDETTQTLHVTRGLECHVWEAVGDGATIESQAATRWVRELVGTVVLGDYATPMERDGETRCLIQQAIVGTSRLPLTSVEAPLPAFSLGQLAYLPRSDDGDRPLRSWVELLGLPIISLAARDRVVVLETVLRTIPADAVPVAANLLTEWLAPLGPLHVTIPALVRRMFNDVSLSPYTDFVDRTLAVLTQLVEIDALDNGSLFDLLGYLIRQLARHLWAYDLILFHYRGANYPDALLLDALLGRYLVLARTEPALLTGESPAARLRRRALRHGCLLRRHYEGHAVPDVPTSPGENSRVLPAPFTRVPEEQILQPGRRTRILFTERPLSTLVDAPLRPLLAQANADLSAADERRELGMALFIERPLGFRKAPAEVDRTPLLSYVAFSERLARQRLGEWGRLMQELDIASPSFADGGLATSGLPAARVPESFRPAVSLADARKGADDYVILRTTRSSAWAFWDRFDTTSHPWVRELPLIVRVTGEDGTCALQGFDQAGRLRIELDADLGGGFVTRGGVELPRNGLLVTRAWDEAGDYGEPGALATGVSVPSGHRLRSLTLPARHDAV